MRSLIDADILLYRVGHIVETPIDWGGDVWTLHADLGEAKSRFLHHVEKARAPGCDEAVLCVSHSPTVFRHDIYPFYKQNRSKGRKPVTHVPLRQWILEGCPDDDGFPRYKVECWEGLEADDVMGIIATTPETRCDVICSIDKDLRTVPGLHYNFDKDSEVVMVSDKDAREFLLTQCIAGDATDGIPGIPGIGMVKARNLLEKHGYEWQAVLDSYESFGLSKQDALCNSWLVCILTADLWKQGKPHLVPFDRPGATPMKVREALTYYGVGREEFAV